MDQTIVFKCIVLGHQGVGKTSMLNKYIKGEFTDQYTVTCGVQFSTRSVKIDEKTTAKLQFWDTAGQQAFRAIMRSFYKGICGIFLTFSIDNYESFRQLEGWLKQARQNSHEEVLIFLVGARADLENARKVEAEAANNYIKEINAVFYIETSAKTGYNIQLLFQKAAKIMHKKFITNYAFRNLVKPMMSSMVDMPKGQSFKLTAKDQPKKKKCCS